MKPSFIHLKVHSEYSLIDGIVRIDDLITRAKDLNMPAVALTDHMNLFGLIKFYRRALAAGIKPIIGADIVIKEEQQSFMLTLLCKNHLGYQQLTTLLSRAYLEGQTSAGVFIHRDWLETNSSGLIVLSGGIEGDIGHAILQGQLPLAEQRLLYWLKYFPQDFYIELQQTARPNETHYLAEAIHLAVAHSVPVVATNAVRFIDSDDYEAHEARVCIHDGYVLEDSRRPHRYSEQQYFKSAEMMQDLFADLPEALANSVEIAKRCNVVIKFGEVFLPRFPLAENINLDDYFIQQAEQGLQQRLALLEIQEAEQVAIYERRLQREVSVINDMGFAGYFLIVADFISWSKQQQIPVGPGRGSGAGSLVAYSLGITELDPIAHELLFERFLNPERVSMPDFDIDFCMAGRDRVIEYVAEHYGHDAVAQIITYGTMAAKAVVRDVGRVLGLPYGFVDKVAKLIPFELGITLDKALTQQEELARRYRQEEEVQTLIDLAKKLEGITRNAGKHAGGVVIAPTKLVDFTPLYCEAGGEHVVTQFDKDDVEAVGLVKFDFLGLRTLTIIDRAIRAINQQKAAVQETLIDIRKIPLDDNATFNLLKRCSTTAVFQLESRGMKELIRRLQPDSFDDITALVALFRPGPLQSGMVDDFIDRKHGRSAVHYQHPDLEPILSSTYGVILYQEQVMQIAQVLAGYSLGGADILRRAMGKKKAEEMAEQRMVFIRGALKKEIDQALAEHIFDLMEKFAGYGFNKSHSVAYALIAYQTAWLKAHYPAQFMAAVLSADMDNTDKVVSLIAECRSMDITILPPNINRGSYHFVVNHAGQIEYGLGAVKGLGEAVVENCVACRERDGDFANLFDLCQRLDSKKVTKRMLEPLVYSGALDCFAVPREHLFASIAKALKAADQSHRDNSSGQGDLFGVLSGAQSNHLTYTTAEPWLTRDKLFNEKSVLGLFLSGHPVNEYKDELSTLGNRKISELPRLLNKKVTVVGLVTAVRYIVTKTHRRMALVTLEDSDGQLEITLFSDLYEKLASQLVKDSIYIVTGDIQADDYTGGVRLVAEKMMSLADMREQMVRKIVIRICHKQKSDGLIESLSGIFRQYRGERCRVTIAYDTSRISADLRLGDEWRVRPCHDLLAGLSELLGSESVTLCYS